MGMDVMTYHHRFVLHNDKSILTCGLDTTSFVLPKQTCDVGVN
jgi:hypothetical protein